MKSSAWLSTKLHTAVQTLLTCCLVQNAAAQSVTGTTSLTNYDLLSYPCTAHAPSNWFFVAWPAPFGETQLVHIVAGWCGSDSSVVCALDGTATDSWFDLTAHGAYPWAVTDKFNVGISAHARAFGARTFELVLEGGMDAQATVQLDTMWTFGMGVYDMLTASTVQSLQPRTIRLGVAFTTTATLAFDVIASTNSATGIQISGLISLHENVKLRTRILSAPLIASLDVQLHLEDYNITILFDHHTNIGSRVGVAVELPSK